MGRNRMPKSNIMAICICSKLLCSISSVLVYYGPQSHLRVKSYARLNFPVDSRFNFERLDLLWAVVGHLSQKLWHLEFARRFCVQFRESRSVMGHNQPFESNVMAIWICTEVLYSISRVSICYGPQSDFQVKSYVRLNFTWASLSNFERRDTF